MQRPLVIVSFLALALAIGSGPSSAHSQSDAGQPAAAPSLAGVYRNVASDGGRAAIVAGTDEALSHAGPVVRSLARPRLLDNNPPVHKMTIRLDGGRASVTYGGFRTYRGPLGGGSPLEQRAPDGSDVRVHYQMERGALVEIAEARQGSGRIRYARNGDNLVVRTVIESRFLPAPIRFTLRFRAEGAAQ